MTVNPVADLYLITYEDGKPYKYTRDANEAIDAIGGGFKVEEFVSLENHRAAMLQGADGNSPVIQNGWVACGERMPPQGDYVSVVSRHGEYVSGLVNDEWLELHDGTSFGMDEIYLWVPLPAVPQREA